LAACKSPHEGYVVAASADPTPPAVTSAAASAIATAPMLQVVRLTHTSLFSPRFRLDEDFQEA
jgi:hypothetical protein